MPPILIAFFIFMGAFFSLGCAQIIPDWNARTQGKIDLIPGYYSWTAPRWEASTRTGECEVFVYARVNHRGPVEIRIRRALDWIDLPPVISTKQRLMLPPGHNTIKIWFVEEEETAAYHELSLNCRELMREQRHIKPAGDL